MYQLFIVGLPRDMDEAELLELTLTFGGVDDLKIIREKETRKSKGYGFITMSDKPAAERVIANMNGSTIDGRTLTVRFADEKTGSPMASKKQRPRRTKQGN